MSRWYPSEEIVEEQTSKRELCLEKSWNFKELDVFKEFMKKEIHNFKIVTAPG